MRLLRVRQFGNQSELDFVFETSISAGDDPLKICYSIYSRIAVADDAAAQVFCQFRDIESFALTH